MSSPPWKMLEKVRSPALCLRVLRLRAALGRPLSGPVSGPSLAGPGAHMHTEPRPPRCPVLVLPGEAAPCRSAS